MGGKPSNFMKVLPAQIKKIDPVTNDSNFRGVELEHISQETGKIKGETGKQITNEH